MSEMPPQKPEGTMAPQQGPAAPTSAESGQVVTESLNIAIQAGLEAAKAAQGDPNFPEETRMKLEQAVLTLSEVQEEMAGAAAAAPQPSTAGSPPQNQRPMP